MFYLLEINLEKGLDDMQKNIVKGNLIEKNQEDKDEI